jgi:signal peptidase II
MVAGRMSARTRAILIIAAVVLIDRITKIYIRTHVSQLDLYPVIPGFFNIIHIENPGAAFGLFSEAAGQWKTVFLVGVSLVVMITVAGMLFRKPAAGVKLSGLLQTGLALVFGGALGNFWDRAFGANHTVTDFLQFFFGSYEYPSFNAADSAIFIGAALLLIDLWRSREGTGVAGRKESEVRSQESE